MQQQSMTLGAWLLLSLSTIGCCGKPVLREDIDPQVVVLQTSAIRTSIEYERDLGLPVGTISKHVPEGWYIVTDGFLADRLQKEQATLSALAKCEDESEGEE